MSTKENVIQNLMDETDSNKIENLTKEIINNFEDYYENEDLYKLPINNILYIVSQIDFKSIHTDIVQLIKKIVSNTSKFHHNECALLLHSLHCKDLKMTIDDCISIFDCFGSCDLCSKIVNLYKTDQSVTLDYEYELEARTREIKMLREELSAHNLSIAKPDDYEPDIIKAASEGKMKSIKFNFESLLQKDDINKKDSKGRTPLHIACINGDLPLVRYLIEDAHSDIEATTNNGYAPIHSACEGGHLEIVQYLIKAAHVDKEAKTADSFKNTPLHIACMKGHLPIVQYLIEDAGVDKNAEDNLFLSTALHIACEYGNCGVVQYLIEKASLDMDAKDIRGRKPLHIACEENQLPVIHYFIKKLNITDPPQNFESNIHVATETGNFNSVQYLIEKLGIDKDDRDINGVTPLHLACRYGFLHIVQYLIEKQGANKEAKTKDMFKYTPLLFACANNHIEIVIYLVDKAKANIDAADGMGNTALHFASSQGNSDMVKFLISRGCNKKVKNQKGNKPSAMTNNIKLKFLLYMEDNEKKKYT